MEERLSQADRLIGVFSDAYCDAIYSQSERWAAYWEDPDGRKGFLVPIEVLKVTKWPPFVKPLNRLSLIDRGESEAARNLTAFLEPRSPPSEKPDFPGNSSDDLKKSIFTEGGEPLGSLPPVFPAELREDNSLEEVGPVSLDTIDPNISIRCIDDHEPRPAIFGRDDECERIVVGLLDGKTIVIAGGPGMGKTAVATAALYDSRITARFGRRRVFASLEMATEPRAILAKLVEALGPAPMGDEASLLRILQVNAADRPLAAVLDNAETVFDANRAESERILNIVAQIQGVHLAVTIRGVPPHIPGAVQIDNISKLDQTAALEAFLAVAGEFFRDDPSLLRLLRVLDGHALSIRLVAAQAIGASSLAGLQDSWDEAHSEILRIAGEDENRLTSVRASLALSLNCRRMKATPLARRLLALLALLPGGLPESNAHSLLGERGTVTKLRAHEAVTCLHQLRLVERRPDHRLRMLTPLRECLKIDLPPMTEDRKRVIDHYLLVAATAGEIGSNSWGQHKAAIEAEADNLDAVCGLAVESNISHKRLLEALFGLSEFVIFTGLGETRSIENAANRKGPPTFLVASCMRFLGTIASMRGDLETAVMEFKRALPLFRHLKDMAGEGACLRGLATIADLSSDNAMARQYNEEAIARYERIGGKFGKAACVKALGDTELRRGNLELAESRYLEALAACERMDDPTGAANCKIGLGNVARARSDIDAADEYYRSSLTLNLRAGSIRNQAHCLAYLGDIARIRRDVLKSKKFYQDALELYRSSGNIFGEAETTIRLGQLQQLDPSEKQAHQTIRTGFDLYFSNTAAHDRALPGWKAVHLALGCDNQDDAGPYFEQARSSWTAIERLDLISQWLDER